MFGRRRIDAKAEILRRHPPLLDGNVEQGRFHF